MIAILASAIGRRMAGGLLSQWLGTNLGDVPVRILWGALVSAALCVSMPWWLACICGFGLPVGLTIRGNAGQALASWRDGAMLTLHGVVVVAIHAAALAAIGAAWWWPVCAEVLCAPCYAVANVIPIRVQWLGIERGGAPLAELLWGGLLGAALVAA